MEYREIVAVTGLGGLYQLLGTKSDGAIVRNIADKSTRFISSRQHNVTPLESIEVYTTGNNVYLHEVFQKMKESHDSNPPLDGKVSNDDVKAYFSKVYPELDEERVYVSDMKKMLKWYVILKDNDLLNFEKAEEATEEPAEATEAKEEKPAKKATKKAEATEKTEEAAPKKAAKKKKAPEKEDGEAAPKKTAKKKKAE